MPPEGAVMRAIMLVAYVVMTALPAVWVVDSLDSPFTDWLLNIGRVLLVVGGIIGAVAVLVQFWWLERSALFALLAAIAMLAAPVSVTLPIALVILLGIGLTALFSYRLYAIRGVWVAPPRRRRRR